MIYFSDLSNFRKVIFENNRSDVLEINVGQEGVLEEMYNDHDVFTKTEYEDLRVLDNPNADYNEAQNSLFLNLLEPKEDKAIRIFRGILERQYELVYRSILKAEALLNANGMFCLYWV